MDSQFIFAACQCGAEAALKAEIATNWPAFRMAFGRPGFVTFKNGGKPVADRFNLKSTFARAYGFSIGHVQGDDEQAMARMVCQIAGAYKFNQIHIWPRDKSPNVPLDAVREYDVKLEAVKAAVLAEATKTGIFLGRQTNGVARDGDTVLDVILVDPDRWWIGRHVASSIALRQPGGVFSITPPENMVSRAYLKMTEALRWSRLPIAKGDHCVEIGSAPGGACQALLERGLNVTGIDPSLMHEDVMSHPRFRHIRKRGADLRRNEYRPFRWLTIDTNVAPKHTLDTVENIVTHEDVNIKGMLITLKMLEWELATHIPKYIERIRSWGYHEIRVRQLAYNRQEVCVAALKNKASIRLRPKRKSKSKRNATKPNSSLDTSTLQATSIDEMLIDTATVEPTILEPTVLETATEDRARVETQPSEEPDSKHSESTKSESS